TARGGGRSREAGGPGAGAVPRDGDEDPGRRLLRRLRRRPAADAGAEGRGRAGRGGQCGRGGGRPMTRIISGVARGRRLVAPKGDATRPTTDRAREAIFSSWSSRFGIEGTTVLDLFAGSGALGLE